MSPEAQSIPNRAAMSPAAASAMSSMLSACIRTRRPTLIFCRERVLTSSVALFDPALVDPDVGQLAVGAVLELEGEEDGRRGRIGRELDLGSAVVEVEGEFSTSDGIGKVADDPVEQRLDALVLVGRAQEDGRQLAGDRPAADGLRG